MAKNSLDISIKGNDDIVRRWKKLKTGGEKALERTASDFASRAPGWIIQAIRQRYGVDKETITNTATKIRRGKISTTDGIAVDGCTITYKGRTLTPVHFNMSPKAPSDTKRKKVSRIPGQDIANGSPVAMIHQPHRYKVKATIVKGQRITFGQNTFLAHAGKSEDDNGNNKTKIIPWQRTGDGRSARPIHTLSVPQMIDGRAHAQIDKTINDNLGKRFDNQIEQILK